LPDDEIARAATRAVKPVAPSGFEDVKPIRHASLADAVVAIDPPSSVSCYKCSDVALASMLASEMSSATSGDVPRGPGKLVFRGVPIEAQEESVKCDIKHVSGVSLRRLVDRGCA
jgi:hypothetical protein